MQSVHGYFEYAGFLRRILAFVLDTLMVSIISSVLLLTLYGRFALTETQQIDTFFHHDWRMSVIDYGLPAVWSLGFWLLWQATPGKLLLDCEIVDAKSQQRAKPVQLLIRYLGYIASAIPLGLGFLWILWDRQKQGFHDKLAGTVVVMHDSSRQPLKAMI